MGRKRDRKRAVKPLDYTITLRLWCRQLHARSLSVTSAALADHRRALDRMRDQAARIAYEGLLQTAAIGDAIQMIEASEAAESLLDPDKTPVMARVTGDTTEDDTQPDGKIVPPKSMQH